jgi:hypothetical protein
MVCWHDARPTFAHAVTVVTFALIEKPLVKITLPKPYRLSLTGSERNVLDVSDSDPSFDGPLRFAEIGGNLFDVHKCFRWSEGAGRWKFGHGDVFLSGIV